MEMSEALEWASKRKYGILITIRADGRPQSSDIVYALEDSKFLISVTEHRAKVGNMRRDSRVTLHLSDPESWTYLSFAGTVELLPATRAIDDLTNDALVDYYQLLTEEGHSDWMQYRQAMIAEGRLLVKFSPVSVVGQMN